MELVSDLTEEHAFNGLTSVDIGKKITPCIYFNRGGESERDFETWRALYI